MLHRARSHRLAHLMCAQALGAWLLCWLLGFAPQASLAHTHSPRHSESEAENRELLFAFLAQLSRHGVRPDWGLGGPPPDPPPESAGESVGEERGPTPYVRLGRRAERVELDSPQRKRLRAVFEAAAQARQDQARQDQAAQGFCGPPGRWRVLRERAQERLWGRRFWLELSGQALEYAWRAGPVLAVAYVLVEALDPMHGVGCKLINGVFLGATEHLHFGAKAAFDNQILSGRWRERAAAIWNNFRLSWQYRRALQTVFIDQDLSLLNRSDFTGQVAHVLGVEAEWASASPFWAEAWQSFQQAARAATAAQESSPAAQPTRPRHDYRQSWERLTDDLRAQHLRFFEALDLSSYLRLELDVAKAICLDLAECPGGKFWPARRFVIRLSMACDRLSENLRLLALRNDGWPPNQRQQVKENLGLLFHHTQELVDGISRWQITQTAELDLTAASRKLAELTRALRQFRRDPDKPPVFSGVAPCELFF